MWCGFAASFIIGPYFFKETGTYGSFTHTITGQHYECFLRNHVISYLLHCGCVDEIIFMQDGIPRNIANVAKQLVKLHFGIARLFSRRFPTAWPPRSLDLNSCYFWLWDYLKDVVFSAPIAH
ncbi:uncharacterized protein TNCV_3458271 [Trichonephila clavipes]|nr:uncharacterized protein TNCV_3458271 [Trichonephila clavipes]